MKLSPIDPALPPVAVDASLLYDTTLIPSSERLVEEMRTILREAGVEALSDLEDDILTGLLLLIVKRDEEVYNHAYRLGRQSV